MTAMVSRCRADPTRRAQAEHVGAAAITAAAPQQVKEI
jgi:hypothetical protein